MPCLWYVSVPIGTEVMHDIGDPRKTYAKGLSEEDVLNISTPLG